MQNNSDYVTDRGSSYLESSDSRTGTKTKGVAESAGSVEQGSYDVKGVLFQGDKPRKYAAGKPYREIITIKITND